MEINTEIKAKILNSVKYAPTGDNSQHWKTYFNEANVLIIEHDANRAEHILNDNLSASLLSLGTIIEILSIQSSEFSLEPVIEFLVEDVNELIWAKVSFKENLNIEKDHLISCIAKRETNRRGYKKEDLTHEFFNDLKSFGKEHGVGVHKVSKPNKALKDYLIDCELYIWHNRQVFLDTMKWVRFTKDEVEKTRDGFGLKNLNLNPVDGIFIKLFRKSFSMLKIFWYLGMSLKLRLDARKSISRTSNILFFTLLDKSSLSLINVGRVYYRTWLSLSKIGHGVQPLTISSLLPYDLEKYGKLRNCPENYIEKFLASHDIFNMNSTLSSEEKVVWAMRSGKCKPLEIEARTLRLS